MEKTNPRMLNEMATYKSKDTMGICDLIDGAITNSRIRLKHPREKSTRHRIPFCV